MPKALDELLPDDFRIDCLALTAAGKSAFRTISDKVFSNSMEGVVHEHDPRIKDEAPAAYKDMRRVMRAQKDLVRVLHELQPLLSVKGC